MDAIISELGKRGTEGFDLVIKLQRTDRPSACSKTAPTRSSPRRCSMWERTVASSGLCLPRNSGMPSLGWDASFRPSRPCESPLGGSLLLDGPQSGPYPLVMVSSIKEFIARLVITYDCQLVGAKIRDRQIPIPYPRRVVDGTTTVSQAFRLSSADSRWASLSLESQNAEEQGAGRCAI